MIRNSRPNTVIGNYRTNDLSTLSNRDIGKAAREDVICNLDVNPIRES